MSIEITITNAGYAALVNAGANGTNAVQITAFGLSDVAVTPSSDLTALPNENKRLASVSGGVVSPSTIHVVLQDTGTDAYALRSFGLYLADGTLFGVYGQPDPLVIKTANSDVLLTTDIQFANIDVSNVTFGATNFFNPPASETVQGVAEIATQDETNAGTDDVRIVTPKKAKGAVIAWLGFTPIQQGGGAGQQANKVMIGWSGSRLKVQVDASDLGSFVTDNVLAAGLVGINGTGMNRNGIPLWGADNDGAGSGLDADLLDGRDGSYYTNITARLGYTPANRAGDTFDGEVSALRFRARSNGDGMAVAIGDDAWIGDANMANTMVVRGQAIASAGYIAFGTSPYGLGCDPNDSTLRYGGSTVWHSGNDGSGSGLDADLLDGLDSGYYTNITARLGYTPTNRAGDTFTGDVGISHAGNVALILNSVGAMACSLVAQGDGQVVLYRQSTALFASDGNYYNVMVPTLLRQGQKVWDAGNDGAGSGLDADLLDGQDSGYYTNITARLGYTPASRAGDTFDGEVSALRFRARSNGDGLALSIGDDAWIGDNNITSGISIRGQQNFAEGYVAFGNTTTKLGCYGNDATLRYGGNPVWHAGNDGAGSGLDADLLDGQDSGYYTNIIGRLGYTPANRGGDTFTGDVAVAYAGSASIGATSAGVVTTRLTAQTDGQVVLYRFDSPLLNSEGTYVNIGLPLIRQGNRVWDAGNDGSGSGLDADTLDGLDSTAFVRALPDNTLASEGHRVHADGFKECWGTVTIGAGQSVYVTLPVGHSAWFNVGLAPYVKGTSNAQFNTGLGGKNGLDGFTLQNWESAAITVDWHTRGV